MAARNRHSGLNTGNHCEKEEEGLQQSPRMEKEEGRCDSEEPRFAESGGICVSLLVFNTPGVCIGNTILGAGSSRGCEVTWLLDMFW